MGVPSNAGVVVYITGQDDTGKVLDQVEARLKRTATPAADLGRKLGDGMEHAVPQVAAASAAIRTFEGQIPIRAVERLLTLIPGVGEALQVAFPVIGGLVFGEMIVENINKLRQMAKEADEATKRAEQAFGEAAGKIRDEANALAVANDRLEEQIGKLEKKPGNGLKAALDEAREAADKLDTALQADVKTMQELLEKNKVSFFQHVTGQASTDKDAQDISAVQDAIGAQSTLNTNTQDGMRSRHADEYSALQARGAGKDELLAKQKRDQQEEQQQAEHGLAELQKIYEGPQAKKLRQTLRDLQQLQGDKAYKVFGGEDQGRRIAMIGGALDIWDQRQRKTGEEYYSGNLKGQQSQAQAQHDADENAKNGADAQAKIDAARAKYAESERKLAEAQAQQRLQSAKTQANADLAQLDSEHKDRLVSDEDYYRRRAAIQKAALGEEINAERSKKSALEVQISKASVQPVRDEGGRQERAAKVNELKAQELATDSAIFALVQKRGAIDLEYGNAAEDRARQRLATEDEIAARLEASRGGGTAARTKQLQDQYDERRAGLDGNASPETLQALKDQLALDKANLQAQEAERAAARANQGASADRANVSYRQRAGQIGSGEARSENAQLSRREGDNLEPVLAAYRELAAGGDLQAGAKVLELQEKIYELRNPIDEISEHMRESFSNAFEGLFLNFDQGASKAFQSFSRSLEQTLQKAVYEKTVQPQVERLAGFLTQGLGYAATRRNGGAGQGSSPEFGGGVNGGVLGDTAPLSNAIGGLGGVAGADGSGALPMGTLASLFRPFNGGSSKGGGIFGGLAGLGSGVGGKSQGRIIVELHSDTPMQVAQTTKQGSGLDQWEVHASDSYGTGGILRQLLHGLL